MSASPKRAVRQAPPQHAPVFQALGDQTRLWLVGRLADGAAHNIAELSDGARVSRQAVTKHLHVLENAGVVTVVRSGREQRYTLRQAPLEEAREYLEQVSRHWDAALARLQALVEE